MTLLIDRYLKKKDDSFDIRPNEGGSGGLLIDRYSTKKKSEPNIIEIEEKKPLFQRIKSGIQSIFPKKEESEKRSKTLDFLSNIISGGVKLPEKNLIDEAIKDKDELSTTGRSFIAGVGDILNVAGSTATWLGKEGLGTNLVQKGAEYQAVAVEDAKTAEEFEWKDMYDPSFYATTVARSVPFTLALIPTAIIGAYGGSAVAGVAGLGAFGTAVLGSIGAASLSRPVEAALEAGGVYDEQIAKGKTKEEADAAADKTFKGNLSLVGLDAAEFIVAFAPTPKGTKPWVRALMRVAGITGNTLMEGSEEVVQSAISTSAQGEEFDITSPETQQEFAIGSIMGAGHGSAGAVFNKIKSTVVETFPNEYQTEVDKNINKGSTPEAAEMQALDTVTEKHPKEVEKLVEQTVKKMSGVSDEQIAAVEAEEVKIPKVEVKTKTVIEVSKKEAKLPSGLAFAKPRFGYGSKGLFSIDFESDVDKALFIVAQEKPSASDEKYMDFLRNEFGELGDGEIRSFGRQVKASIKDRIANDIGVVDDVVTFPADAVEVSVKREVEAEKPKVVEKVEKKAPAKLSKELEPIAKETRKFKSLEEFQKEIKYKGFSGNGMIISDENLSSELQEARRNVVRARKSGGAEEIESTRKNLQKIITEFNEVARETTPFLYTLTKDDKVQVTGSAVSDIDPNAFYKTEILGKDVLKIKPSEVPVMIKELKEKSTKPYKSMSASVAREQISMLREIQEGSKPIEDFYKQVTQEKVAPKQPLKEKKAVVSKPPVLKEVTTRQVETIKDIKGVKATLKRIRAELSAAVVEAEGLSLLAQEQRAGLNTQDIAKLKSTVALNQKFREGDIETVRASKAGKRLERVIENVREVHPEMSDEEAYEFALNLPTKAQESPKTSVIRELEKKEKKLSKFLDLLKARQNELKIKADEELSKEWERALAVQEKLIQVINVPISQVPVGRGVQKVSRLEARLKGALDQASQEQIDELGLSTYNQANQKEQIALAMEYTQANPDDALRVISGEIAPPKGILKNAIYGSLVELGSMDTVVATKVATAASTRFGQEINILKTILADNPVVMMQDVVDVRIKAYEKRTGKKATERVKKEIDKITKEVKAPDRSEWDSFIEKIRC